MKWIIRLIAALAVMVAVAFGGIMLLPAERIGALVTAQLTQSLGRAVTIEGGVRPAFWPHLGVQADGIRIANPDWADGDGAMIGAQTLSVGVEIAPLLAGEIRIAQARLIAPEISLIRAADGRVNWAFETSAPSDGTTQAPEIGVDRVEIRGAQIRYLDQGTGQAFTLSGLDLDATQSGAGLNLTGGGAINGARADLAVQIADLAQSLSGAAAAMDLSLAWSGGNADFAGQAGFAPLDVQGRLTVTASDITPLGQMAAIELPAIPRGLGRDEIALAGDLTLDEAGSLRFDNGQLRLDGAEIALALAFLTDGARPKLQGTVQADSLDLSALTQSGDTGAAGGGWSSDPIDLTGLGALDADIALAIGALDLGVMRLSQIDTGLALAESRLVATINRASAYGGGISGQTVLNGRGAGSIGADIALQNIALQPLLRDMIDMERLSGTGTAQMNLIASGASVAAWMGSLQGALALSLGEGAIEGFDLAGMIRNLDTAYRGDGARTVYDSVTSTWAIAGGVAQNDDLSLAASWGGVTGAGRVDIGGQSVQYRLVPAVQTSSDGSAIAVPVLIEGPWSNLRFAPDLEYLATQRLELEREAIEAQARERLETEARERLNVAPEGDIQDALEDRLRNEAQDALRNLLGGN